MEKKKRTFTPEQIQRGNERAKRDYDRIAVFAPKEKHIKERIKALGNSSVNGYIMQAVENQLEIDENAIGSVADKGEK